MVAGNVGDTTVRRQKRHKCLTRHFGATGLDINDDDLRRTYKSGFNRGWKEANKYYRKKYGIEGGKKVLCEKCGRTVGMGVCNGCREKPEDCKCPTNVIDIALCRSCYCMTYTMEDYTCGKCGKEKQVIE